MTEIKTASRWEAVRGSHRGWVVEVAKSTHASIEVRVVKGQARGKSARVRLYRELFERDFAPRGGR